MSLSKVMMAAALFGAPLAMVSAEELKSGPKAGTQIAAFEVVKHSGAADDGVEAGKTLCYRCKYGSSPMVMVFTRTSEGEICKFLSQLDATVMKHSDHGLKGFVNLLGGNQGELEALAKTIGTHNKAVPVVVPVEFENGPEGYELSPDAEVTVVLANKGQVVSTHAVPAGKFNAETTKKILAEAEKLCHST